MFVDFYSSDYRDETGHLIDHKVTARLARRDGTSIMVGQPVSVLFANHIALALISLGEAVNSDEGIRGTIKTIETAKR